MNKRIYMLVLLSLLMVVDPNFLAAQSPSVMPTFWT